MFGQDHWLGTAHFSVESGHGPPESQQIIVLTQCSRFLPFPKATEASQSQGFWVGSGFMKKQQLLQEQGDPRSWDKQVTSKDTLMLWLKPMSLQWSLRLLCYTWILTPLSLWVLVIDFKGGQDLFFKVLKGRHPAPLPPANTQNEKKHEHYGFGFFSFQQLSSSTWVSGVTAVLLLILTSSLLLYLCLAHIYLWLAHINK